MLQASAIPRACHLGAAYNVPRNVRIGESQHSLLSASSSPALILQPPNIFQRPPEGKFDLPVKAAQLVIGPPLQGLKYLRVEPKEIWFALRHSYW